MFDQIGSAPRRPSWVPRVAYRAQFQEGNHFFSINREGPFVDEIFLKSCHKLGITRVPGSIDVGEQGITYLFGIPESGTGFYCLPERVAEAYFTAVKELCGEGGVISEVSAPELIEDGVRNFTRITVEKDDKKLITELPSPTAFGLVDRIMRT